MFVSGAQVDHRLESEYREETHTAPYGVWCAGRLQEEVPACLISGQLCPGIVVFVYLTFTLLSFSEAAAKVMVELLGSYTEDNASQARVDAHRYDLLLSLSFDLIWSLFSDLYVRCAQVHRRPAHLMFDHLLALKPVRFLEGELIHDVRKGF